MTGGTEDALIVIVDDELDKVEALRDDLSDFVDVAAVRPDGLNESLLSRGTIFVVDMYINDWPSRSRFDAGSRVYDGIALAGVIRAHARKFTRRRPIVTLNTGHVENLSDLPHEIREHAIARANNLEWVFLKNDSTASAPTDQRVLELALAQATLPETWSVEQGESELMRVLGASETLLDAILEAWPPIHEVGHDSGGVAVLRWLLHRILPYPCFLLDENHVAARLGITVESLRRQQDHDSPFAAALADCRYGGILKAFDGPRWWRQSVESALWTLSKHPGRPANFDALNAAANDSLEPAPFSNGVVVLGSDYKPRADVQPLHDAVRIRLDDWPPYAEDAWTTVDEASADPELACRVMPTDRDRLRAPR